MHGSTRPPAWPKQRSKPELSWQQPSAVPKRFHAKSIRSADATGVPWGDAGRAVSRPDSTAAIHRAQKAAMALRRKPHAVGSRRHGRSEGGHTRVEQRHVEGREHGHERIAVPCPIVDE